VIKATADLAFEPVYAEHFVISSVAVLPLRQRQQPEPFSLRRSSDDQSGELFRRFVTKFPARPLHFAGRPRL
jgi:hypothetical protein